MRIILILNSQTKSINLNIEFTERKREEIELSRKF